MDSSLADLSLVFIKKVDHYLPYVDSQLLLFVEVHSKALLNKKLPLAQYNLVILLSILDIPYHPKGCTPTEYKSKVDRDS
ncbi:hypothetical protein ACTWP4_13355 [Gracilibacillus sp. D59]|uniref:hypothetical protein n=1 Tax=Gracilibacillus sp. D59 TaxID=3457434 RepID=UPI003FCE6D94